MIIEKNAAFIINYKDIDFDSLNEQEMNDIEEKDNIIKK